MLDDGWFRHRRDDTAGLGDWYVDEDVWPDGLHPLVNHVRGLGMEFGLWVEPEMVNPDSDLARAHPEWVREAPLWRNQQVLDIAQPDAYAYLLERLDALVSEYAIDFLKWDHNRDLVGGAHEQTLAVVPAARRAPRPPPGAGDRELLVGRLARRPRDPRAHRPRVGERHQRRARAAVDPALDAAAAAAGADRLARRTAAGAHDRPHARPLVPGRDRAVRPLRDRVGHQTRRPTPTAPGWRRRSRSTSACGRCCTAARSCAPTCPTRRLRCTASWRPTEARRCSASRRWRPRPRWCPARCGCPGLDPDRRYRVTAVPLAGGPSYAHGEPPGWLEDGVTLTGRALGAAGLQMPSLAPEQALVLHLTAAASPGS